MKLKMNPWMIWLLPLGLLISCDSKTLKDSGPITLEPNQHYIVEMETGRRQKFKIKSSKQNFIKVEIDQCNFDVEVKFKNKKGEWVWVDRPSGSSSKESFLKQIFPESDFLFEVYSIEPFKKHGFIEIYFTSVNNDSHFLEKVRAERYYLLGCRKLYSSEIETQRQAIIHFEKSAEIYDSIDEIKLEAETLLKLGLAYYKVNDFSKSINTCLKAMQLHQDFGNTNFDGYLSNTIGAAFFRKQKFESALFYYYKTVAAWERSSKKSIISTTYCNISVIHFRQGAYDLSEFFLNLSLQTATQGRNFFDLMLAYNQFGQYYLSNGQVDQALDYFEKAYELGQSSNNTSNDKFLNSIINLGRSYMRLGDFQQARKWTLKAIEATRDTHFLREKAVALWSLGNIELHDQNLSLAREWFTKSLQVDSKDWSDNSYLSMAITAFLEANEIEFKPSSRAKKLNEAMSYISLTRKAKPDSWVETQAYYWEARVLWEKNDPYAIQALAKGISRIEDKRSQTEDSQAQVSFFATQLHFYQLRLDMLIGQYLEAHGSEYLENIYATSEQIRARALLDRIKPEASTVDKLLSGEDLLAYYKILSKMEENFDDDTSIDRLERELLPLAKKINLLEPVASPSLTVAIQDAAAIKQNLHDSETLLITYAFGLENTYLIALDQQELQVHDLGNSQHLRKKVALIHSFLQEHPLARRGQDWKAYQNAMDALSQALLLGPLKNLEDYRRLVFIPDDFLQLIPFAALPLQRETFTERQRLVDQFEIAILPSASVWKALKDRSQKKKAASRELAIVANPVFNAADPRLVGKSVSSDPRRFFSSLPGTQREAEGIASLLEEKAFVATGFSANRAFITRGDLEDFRYLHFATHGDIDTENPNQSSLILSRFDENGQPVDGSLRLGEIAALSLRADLVSLSACETATGKLIGGEGLMSLARGFMSAGVPRVLGTLWRIPDDATAHFMTEFYRALLKEKRTPAQALRQAQFAQRSQKRWQDPHFWAGFILMGDWQE